MSRRLKLVLLIGLIVVLILLIVKQSVIIYHNLHQGEFHPHKSRHSDSLQVQRWMTVSEIAQKYNVPETDVFQALQIDPEPGDAKLSLRALKEKYHKSSFEMQSNLHRLLDLTDPTGNSHE